jgi:hypothetical protein
LANAHGKTGYPGGIRCQDKRGWGVLKVVEEFTGFFQKAASVHEDVIAYQEAAFAPARFFRLKCSQQWKDAATFAISRLSHFSDQRSGSYQPRPTARVYRVAVI